MIIHHLKMGIIIFLFSQVQPDVFSFDARPSQTAVAFVTPGYEAGAEEGRARGTIWPQKLDTVSHEYHRRRRGEDNFLPEQIVLTVDE